MDDHLAKVPMTENQQGRLEDRDKLFSSVGAENMDTNGCQLFDLGGIEFHLEDLEINMDRFIRPGTKNLFPNSTSNKFEISFVFENPIQIDAEEKQRNSSLFFSVLERPTKPLKLLRFRLS